MGSSLFNFSRRATRDADRMEIRKYDLLTDGHTWVGARDTCVSKNTEHDSSDNDSDDGSRDELAAGKLLWEIQVCLLAF